MVMAFCRLLWRRQSWWPNKTMVMAVDGVVYDCIVCLCEVSRGDEYRKLRNCEHGIQFHAECIDAWLKDHSTCPICRSHIPRPLSQRLHVYFRQQLLQDVISYCNSALESVANSIGDCRDF
ncbi:hypothetical protein L1987_87409 [Smallanthus sonchifolius]|nr:hypothetical protein L1987_87409 [Smallanthus sonchifolius]